MNAAHNGFRTTRSSRSVGDILALMLNSKIIFSLKQKLNILTQPGEWPIVGFAIAAIWGWSWKSQRLSNQLKNQFHFANIYTVHTWLYLEFEENRSLSSSVWSSLWPHQRPPWTIASCSMARLVRVNLKGCYVNCLIWISYPRGMRPNNSGFPVWALLTAICPQGQKFWRQSHGALNVWVPSMHDRKSFSCYIHNEYTRNVVKDQMSNKFTYPLILCTTISQSC
jgi:hypothetical protein